MRGHPDLRSACLGRSVEAAQTFCPRFRQNRKARPSPDIRCLDGRSSMRVWESNLDLLQGRHGFYHWTAMTVDLQQTCWKNISGTSEGMLWDQCNDLQGSAWERGFYDYTMACMHLLANWAKPMRVSGVLNLVNKCSRWKPMHIWPPYASCKSNGETRPGYWNLSERDSFGAELPWGNKPHRQFMFAG